MIPQKLIEQYKNQEIFIKDIVKELQISYNSVYYQLKKLGIKTDINREGKIQRNIQIIKFFEEGYNLVQIGKIFNISKQRVYQIIKDRRKYASQ